MYFNTYPQFFHIHDQVEFDRIAGQDLKSDDREELRSDDFICPSIESSSSESMDGPQEAYGDRSSLEVISERSERSE